MTEIQNLILIMIEYTIVSILIKIKLIIVLTVYMKTHNSRGKMQDIYTVYRFD